jgi:hypothetical protein
MSDESCNDFRTCRKCGEQKPRTEEFWYRTGDGFRRGRCKECLRARGRERAAARRKRLGVKPIRRVVGHTYPSGIAVLARVGKARWFECRCHCGKIFECTNPSLRKSCGCVKLKDGADLRNLYRSYRAGAVSRGLDFSITLEEFAAISGQNCAYCNSPPRTRKYRIRLITFNGVDRLDSSSGYTSGNVVPCCKRCNIAKLDSTVAEFAEWIDAVAKHRPNWRL